MSESNSDDNDKGMLLAQHKPRLRLSVSVPIPTTTTITMGVCVGFIGIFGAKLYSKIKQKLLLPPPPTTTTISTSTPSPSPPPTTPPSTSIPSPSPSPPPTPPLKTIVLPPSNSPIEFAADRPREYTDAICPSAAVLFLDRGDGIRLTSFGFVASTDDQTTTVWGGSTIFYDYNRWSEGKFLSKGKVGVTLQGGRMLGKSFMGTLVHVNYTYDLAVIKLRGFDSSYAKIATLAPLDGLVSHCLDFINFMETYLPARFTLSGAHENPCSCTTFQHFQWPTPFRGICLNTRLEIVGLKTGVCDYDSKLVHVLPAEIIIDILAPASSSKYIDIRLLEKETRISREFLILHPECCEPKVTISI
ncbi:hypothetical protein AQUCO_06700044v1 [Aquilegia coerulea]|uniref:Uncharacterized protein n=1 Tax=Aquilegia coerulea TaxID=218851 RepID=A0A2G5CBX3_AQUCA|nr:hypothetical protein AQUCO_06700044v1 [Aquilegia coerulea]PIA28756.1 hypothetical protein AQUCO_06700044v1 [Aquilegia coerulea]